MITFIIPAHNEGPLISRTINAIQTAANAANEPYEIIVVDDASTDATATVAAHFGARVISIHDRQISVARNAGAAQARGELLVFVDADTQVPGTIVVRPCMQSKVVQSAAVPGHGSMSQSQSTGEFWNGYGCGLFSRSGTWHPVVSCSAHVMPSRRPVDSTKPCTPPRT